MTTYTPIARLPVMTPRDAAVKDAWGDIINASMPAIEQVAAGVSTIDLTGVVTGSPIVLSTANDAPDQARPAMLLFVGTAGAGPINIQIPQVARIGWVSNQSNQAVVLGTIGGTTTLTVPSLNSFLYRCDGSAVIAVPLSVSGSLTSPNGVLINNAAAYAGNDTTGTPRNMLALSAANATALFVGPTGLVIRNQADTQSLVIVTPAGAVSFAGPATVTGQLTASGTLSVQGAATFAAGLAVQGAISAVGGLNAGASQVLTTGRGTFGDVVLSSGNLFMNNGTAVFMKDAGGTYRAVLEIGPDNFTDNFNAGGAGWRVLNQAGSAALFNLDNVGNATFVGPVTTPNLVATAGTIGGIAISGGVIGAHSTPNVAATVGTVGGVTFAGSGNINAPGAISAGSLTSGNTVGTIGTIGGVVFAGGSVLNAGGVSTMGGINVTGNIGPSSGNSGFLATGGATVGAWNVNIGIAVTNSVSAGAFVTTSDARLKTDIEDLTQSEGVRWIRAGRPRRYTMGGRAAAGFVAQEDVDNGRAAAVGYIADDRPEFAAPSPYTPAGHRLVRRYEHDIAFITAALQNALDRLDKLEADQAPVL